MAMEYMVSIQVLLEKGFSARTLGTGLLQGTVNNEFLLTCSLEKHQQTKLVDLVVHFISYLFGSFM